MKIVVLVENKTENPALETRKGLSLYIEKGNRRILFDAGPDGSFIRNAARLGVDLMEVDAVVISHGHDDHGGGLADFLELNKKASVYIHELAFGNYVVSRGGERYIGLDKKLESNDRVVLTFGCMVIGEGIKIVTAGNDDGIMEGQNEGLFERKGGEITIDMFRHEQNLLLSENGMHVLLTGCAHRGIASIIESVSAMENLPMDLVIGGFHLNKFSKEELEQLGIAEKLKELGAFYITGHCTGEEQFAILKETLGDKISYLSTGRVIEI
ncbi:MAG: MBL fold metallo-hydrolase [Clostridia bacterium]|nr:MBL fold metallo-hydrolase [Clostridia bacterium]